MSDDTTLQDASHEGPIKTPRQLVAAVAFAFVVPVLVIALLATYVSNDSRPAAGSNLLDREAIAARLGINVIGRHTALGDAFVTGEVFLKMIPLLNEMGIHTLRQALEAAEKTYLARVKY